MESRQKNLLTSMNFAVGDCYTVDYQAFLDLINVLTVKKKMI